VLDTRLPSPLYLIFSAGSLFYYLSYLKHSAQKGIGGQVVEVVLKLDAGILFGGPVALLDKAPGGHARLHCMAHSIERNFLCQLLLELRPFCPGANRAHFASEDIDELGKFVNMCLAENASDAGNPRVIFLSPDSLSFFSIRDHGSELVGLKYTPPLPTRS